MKILRKKGQRKIGFWKEIGGFRGCFLLLWAICLAGNLGCLIIAYIFLPLFGIWPEFNHTFHTFVKIFFIQWVATPVAGGISWDGKDIRTCENCGHDWDIIKGKTLNCPKCKSELPVIPYSCDG